MATLLVIPELLLGIATLNLIEMTPSIFPSIVYPDTPAMDIGKLDQQRQGLLVPWVLWDQWDP